MQQTPLQSSREESRHTEDPRKLELEYQSILSENVATVKQCCELVKELEAELNKAEDFAQITELKEEIKSLLNTQNQAELEIKQILQKIEELQTEEGNKSCVQCEVNLRSLYEENATLQHDLSGKDATIRKLENEKERLTENLNVGKKQKIQTSNLPSDVKSENKKMQKELNVIRKDNGELEQRLQVSEIKKTELLTEIQAIKKDSEAQEQLYKSINKCALDDIATLKKEKAHTTAASDQQNKQMKEYEQLLNVAKMEIEGLTSKMLEQEELSERLKIRESENEEKDAKIVILEEELDKLRKVTEMKEKRIKDEGEQHEIEFQELLRGKDKECKSLSHTLHLKELIIDQYEDNILHLQEQNRQIVTTDEESDKLKVMLREKERTIQELERDLQLSENNISTLNQNITDVKNELDGAQKKLTLRKEESLAANDKFNEMQTRLANLQKEIEVTAFKDNKMEKEIQKLKAENLEMKGNKIAETAKAHLEIRELENKYEMLKKYAEGLLRENDQLKLQARNKDEDKVILDQQPEYALLFCF